MQKKIISKIILGIMLAMSTAAVAETPRDQTPPGARGEYMGGLLASLEVANSQLEYVESNLKIEERRYQELESRSSGSIHSLYEIGNISRDIRESKEIIGKAKATVDGILSNLVNESGVLQSEFGKSIGLRILSQEAVNELYEAGDRDSQARKQHLIAVINGETKIFVGPEFVAVGSSTVMEFYDYKSVHERPRYDQSSMIKRIGEFVRFNFGHAGVASASAGVASVNPLTDQRVVAETVTNRYFSYESASRANKDSKVERALQERQSSSGLRNDPREAVRKVERK